MNELKVLNKEKTITNILRKCKDRINIVEFNKRMSEPNEIEFLIEACELMEVNVVYDS